MQGWKWMLSRVLGVVTVWVVATGTTWAQVDGRRVEVGGQVNLLRLSGSDDVNVGVGGRVTVDLTRWISVEGEYQFMPADELTVASTLTDGSRIGVTYHRRRSTALFGVKAGYRGERAGLFAKVRPGFTSLTDRGIDCLGDVCALILLAVPEYRREFALDVGGVFEFYPTSRLVARLDVGSLMVRHRSTAPPCATGDCTTRNLATSVGVGVRF